MGVKETSRNKPMKRATFAGTVDILVKAYLNGTLERGVCAACAVGNIIKANGYHLNDDDNSTHWLRIINNKIRGLSGVSYNDTIANEQISASGYSINDLNRIEATFEETPKELICSYDEFIFGRLMAVVDVLADIHGIDLKSKEAAKLLFIKETSGD